MVRIYSSLNEPAQTRALSRGHRALVRIPPLAHFLVQISYRTPSGCSPDYFDQKLLLLYFEFNARAQSMALERARFTEIFFETLAGNLVHNNF